MNKEKLIEQLKKDEGFSPVSYWDFDQFTWGFGTKAPGPEARITREEAEKLLAVRAQAAVDDFYDIYAGCVMSERRELALANMAFNLGETKLRKFPKMNAAVRRNDWPRVAKEAKGSRWFTQLSTPENGREERAERIVRELKEG